MGASGAIITVKLIHELHRIGGQKILISYGDHDLADNFIHLVLARTPDAPDGVKGVSLFIVPKFLPGGGGAPKRRNAVCCLSLEHKLGIHGSPTAAFAFGDVEGAIGYRVGEENRGLVYMFTTMNTARLSVGLEGVGITERAYQQGLIFARERQQGQAAGHRSAGEVAIVQHTDVRRMLISMKARIDAMRPASSRAASISALCSTTCDTRFQAKACCASIMSPVKASSAARDMPTTRGSSQAPSSPGMIPSLMKLSANFAFSDAIRMSQMQAR